MQEYVTEQDEYWSLFNQLIKSIPSLVYPFLFSLCEGDHLPPYVLNLVYWKKLLAKFLCQLVPISFNLKGRKRVPHFASPASE
jgi:hypothetical protein